MNTTQKKEIRFQAELRKASTGSRTLRGYAIMFNSRSLPIPNNSGGYFFEQILPGAFSACLQSDSEIRALVDHDPTKIVAKRSQGSLRISEDSQGVAVEIDVVRTSWGDDLLSCVDASLVAGMSFSLYCEEDRWEQITVDGSPVALRSVIRAFTDEVTCTSIPCYPSTTLSQRSYFPDGVPESIELRFTEMRAVSLAAETLQRKARAQAAIDNHSEWQRTHVAAELAAVDEQLRARLEVLKSI
jgi:HK97 family phage prohead protease